MTSKNPIASESFHALKPILQIGKQGINKNVLEEIKKHLKKRKCIKIKCLRYFLDAVETDKPNKEKMKNIAYYLAKNCDAEIIQIVGFTIVLKHTKIK